MGWKQHFQSFEAKNVHFLPQKISNNNILLFKSIWTNQTTV